MTKTTLREWRVYEVIRQLDNTDQPVMLGMPPYVVEHFLVGVTDYDAMVKSAPIKHVLYSDSKRTLTDSIGRVYDITSDADINQYSYAPELILKQYPDAENIREEFL